MKKIFGVLTVFAASAFLYSCGNNDEVAVDELFVEDVNMETTLSALFEDVDEATDFGSSVASIGRADKERKYADCATVTHDETTGVTTIDFGDEGCEGRDGRVRKGKIIITRTGERGVAGWSRSLTFDGYSVDTVSIEGTRSISFVSGGDGEDKVFQTSLVGGKVTFPDGLSVTRDAAHTRTVSFDENEEKVQATKYGSASGINRDGLTYSNSIAEANPLLFTSACREEGAHAPVSGIVTIDVEGESTVTVDYGDGTCDNLATVTKDGVSEEIEVDPKQRRRKHRRNR